MLNPFKCITFIINIVMSMSEIQLVLVTNVSVS